MLTDKPDVCEALDRALIVHLTAVTAEGQPQTAPVWFLRVGDEIVVYNRPDTPRLASIRANDRVSVTMRGDREASGCVTIEGRARIEPDMPPADRRPGYVAKYAGQIAALGWTPESFAADYSVGIVITPTRVRAWDVAEVIAAEEAGS